MGKFKQKNYVFEVIENLAKYYGDNGEFLTREDLDNPEDDSEYEFAYGQYLKDEYGIEVYSDGVRIDLRQLFTALKKLESKIMDPKYDDVCMELWLYDGNFNNGAIKAFREETQEDIDNRERERLRVEEQKKAEKERKAREREQKKIDKLRKEIEKYKDKL